MNKTAQRRLSRACTSLLSNFFVLTLGLGSLMGQPVPPSVTPKVTLFSTPFITSLAGAGWDDSGYSGDGGPSQAALLHYPTADTVDAAGNVYIVDSE